MEKWKNQTEGDNILNSNQTCTSVSQLRSDTFQSSIVSLKIPNKTNISKLKILEHREKEKEIERERQKQVETLWVDLLAPLHVVPYMRHYSRNMYTKATACKS